MTYHLKYDINIPCIFPKFTTVYTTTRDPTNISTMCVNALIPVNKRQGQIGQEGQKRRNFVYLEKGTKKTEIWDERDRIKRKKRRKEQGERYRRDNNKEVQ